MQLDPQAVALNDTIRSANPAVFAMLSARGRGIYFPKLGILSQSADAKGKEINATIGIALEDDGQPMALPGLAAGIALPPGQVFPYAPSPGLPELRAKWGEMLFTKNPSLVGKRFSSPLVTSALTHGISIAAYLFADEGDTLVSPDLYWENYDLIFSNGCGAKIETFPIFAGQGFNLAGLQGKLDAAANTKGKLLLSLNFPNNPTGYTPTVAEVGQLVAALGAAAAAGARIVALVDDAYFGLVYENGIYPESIFSQLCDLHPNLLAVKLDGPTKEDYVWGFRVGFLTFGVRGGTKELYAALEAKAAGAIRGNISNASHPAQSLLLKAYSSPAYAREKAEKFAILKGRYAKVKAILAAHPEYRDEFEPLPFNSGYFMCLKLKRAAPEALRQKLLQEFSTGVIAICGVIRVAFSATPTGKLDKLFANLYSAARALP